MRHQDGGRYSFEVKIERSYQAASPPRHGGDSAGNGCGVRLGIICSLALLLGVGVIVGVGVLYLGCLMFGGGADGGACRMTGVFGE
jgi:hypothetical protein